MFEMDSGYSTKVEENRSVSTLSETDNDENETESCDEFKQFCFSLVSSKPNWNEWILTSDISSKLTSLQLKAGRKLLWHQEETNESTWEAMEAAVDGDENTVALAILIADNHRRLNTMNSQRQTLLHITSSNCSPKLSRLLITRGADGAITNVWAGRADVVSALTLPLTKPEVKHPYFKCPYKSLPQDNVNNLNHDGRAPLHLAAEHAHSKQHQEAIAALHMYAHCDMDIRRLGDGYSASHIAIDNDDEACLEVCLMAKADSEVRNFKGETPQQLAHLCQNRYLVRLCQNYGAGSYQLEFAETEAVINESSDDDDDDDDDERLNSVSILFPKLEDMNIDSR